MRFLCVGGQAERKLPYGHDGVDGISGDKERQTQGGSAGATGFRVQVLAAAETFYRVLKGNRASRLVECFSDLDTSRKILIMEKWKVFNCCSRENEQKQNYNNKISFFASTT